MRGNRGFLRMASLRGGRRRAESVSISIFINGVYGGDGVYGGEYADSINCVCVR